jgi:hypothetical protein
MRQRRRQLVGQLGHRSGPGGPPSEWPGDIQPDRDDIAEPADQLDQRGPALDPEQAGQQRTLDRFGVYQPGQVDGALLTAVQPAGLVRGVQRVDSEAGRDEHQDQAGGVEEPGQVQPDPAPVDQPAQSGRGQQAEHRADTGGEVVVAAIERGLQEQHGLEALAQHRQEGQPDQRPIGPVTGLADRVGGHAFQLALEPMRIAPQPDHQIGHRGGGQHPDDGLEALVLPTGQACRQHGQGHPAGDRQQHGRTDSEVDPAQQVGTSTLPQEGRDDADDQRRFQALAQADGKRRQHRRPLRPSS